MKSKRVKPNTRAIEKAARKGDIPAAMKKMMTTMQDELKLSRLKMLKDRPRIEFEIPAWVELPIPTNKKKTCPLNDDVANRILIAKRAGASDGMAAAYAGVRASDLSKWVNNETDDEPFATFRGLYEKARVFPKFFFLDAIVVNAYYNPELALKMLARLEPEQFAEVMVVKGEHTVGVDDTLAAIMERAIARGQEARQTAPKQIGRGHVDNGTVIPHDPRGKKGAK